MSRPVLGDNLPRGPQDKSLLIVDRMREWVLYLPAGTMFSYHQARRAIDCSWDRARLSLNALQAEGIVQKTEWSRTWRRP